MRCNVGLGYNNKQAMLILLKELLVIQRESLQIGLADAKKIFATLDMHIEQANLGSTDLFFNDPNDPAFKPPQPQPSPQDQVYMAQATALQAETKRKDRELEIKKAEADEAAEAKAADMINAFLAVAGKPALTQAEIAKMLAEITHLNRDKNAQDGPAEDSSGDEMDAAGELLGSFDGGYYQGPAGDEGKPAKAKRKGVSGARNGKAAS
jgi:hypothetical protein